MDEKQVMLDDLSNVNNLNAVDETEKQLTSTSDIDETIALSNALQQSSSHSISDLAQQTLIAVNSQPLIPVVTQGLIGDRPSFIAATQKYDSIDNNAIQTLMPTIDLSNNDSAGVTYEEAVANNSDNNGQVDRSSPLITEFYENFSVGKTFNTLEELRATAFEYGRRYNVALTTSKSDKTKVYLICKHGGFYRKNANKKRPPPKDNAPVKTRNRMSQKSGCSCLIYARCCKGSFWTVRKSIGEHNHPIAADPTKYAMYRSLGPAHLALVHKLLKENTGISSIVKILRVGGVNNIVPKDIENIQQDLKRKEAALKLQTQLVATTATSSSPNSSNGLAMEETYLLAPAPSINDEIDLTQQTTAQAKESTFPSE
jgi:hypothetical protein